VIVVRTTGVVDSSPYELRLRSELQTEGVETIVDANASSNDPKTLANRFGAYGVIDVTISPEEATALVWVSDPTIALDISRSIKVSLLQRDSVAVFALRCVDLFVGARLELEQQRRLRVPEITTEPPKQSLEPEPTSTASVVPATDKPKTPDTTTFASPGVSKSAKKRDNKSMSPASRERNPSVTLKAERFRLGGGIAMMQFTDKLNRRVSAELNASLSLSKHWLIGLTFTGPYLATIVTASSSGDGHYETNQATIDQEFLWLGGRYRWELNSQFELEPNLGLGVARYGVSGDGGVTYTGRHDSAISLQTNVGTTLVWRVSPKIRFLTDLSCAIRWQTPLVVVDGRDETGTSRLNFWGALGPAWVF
jgi:hypothetical protein